MNTKAVTAKAAKNAKGAKKAGIVAITLCVTVLACSRPCRECSVLSDGEFVSLVESLSEDAKAFQPGNGYESDNWVSNERSFQNVIPGLPRLERRAYIGVGPEQNFTYIAYLEPSIAFIVDIRRENLALHLFYKALFELSDDRAGFVARLFCREPIQYQSTDSIEELLERVRAASPSQQVAAATRADVVDRLVHHGLHLRDRDRAAIDTAYKKFCNEGLAVRWSADNRPWIPTYSELMTMKGRDGEAHAFLTSESRFQTVRSMQRSNAIVPVVGDFGGTKALPGIASYLKRHNMTLAAFYVSNVRPYLRGAALDRFEANVADLPADDASVVIETSFHVTQGIVLPSGPGPSVLGPESHLGKQDFETSTYTVPMRH